MLPDIERYLIERIDGPSDRRQHILHPSELAHSDWCPRQSNYRLAHTPYSDPQKPHAHQLENIFDEGHQIHAKWQQRLWDMGRLWGKWECSVCQSTWTAESPKFCPNCQQPKRNLRYREVPLEAEEKYLIAGFEDGAVNDLNALIEIKSIGQGTLRMEDPTLLREHLKETVDGKKVYDLDGIWKGLKRPLPGHIRQTALYLALAKEMGLPYDRVIFLYEYKANQLVKEFNIKYNPRIAEPLLDEALNIKFALSKGNIVPRQPQFHKESKPCSTCPYMSLCWTPRDSQGNPPPSEDGKQLGSGRPLGSRRRAPVGAGSGPTRAASGDDSPATGGSHRVGRSSPDEAVHAVDGVAGVHGSPVSRVRGRREVRRRIP